MIMKIAHTPCKRLGEKYNMFNDILHIYPIWHTF